ncbi:DUF1707 domain-containing protein [Nocardia jinanensis]|uniref:DUF1707 domain-containing protein n=1 Tax=Nocardia jinanensis TaxID=382504 RepID=A0A917VWN8_9NOCA|nr:DUF1707 domain-containing protein [Nocardia jinanensis]GGL34342.1 hypothetical protein GCM10011588_56370 [Nocardia jinanensis]
MSELPGARITVEQRDRALRELADHLGSGLLTLTEYEERTAAATAAQTTPELAALFTDLPAPTPPPAPPETTDPAVGFAMLAGGSAVFTLILALVFGGWLWLLLLVIVLVSAPLLPAVIRRRRATP